MWHRTTRHTSQLSDASALTDGDDVVADICRRMHSCCWWFIVTVAVMSGRSMLACVLRLRLKLYIPTSKHFIEDVGLLFPSYIIVITACLQVTSQNFLIHKLSRVTLSLTV